MPFSRNVSVVADATANDSDKTFTVPADTIWYVLSIYVQYASTATVGNRVLTILVTDASDNPFIRYVTGANQAASLTRHYVFAPGHPNETSFGGPATDTMLRSASDRLTLPNGFKIRVFDSAVIDAAADDMTVRLLIEA
jgi:hypothetical protein